MKTQHLARTALLFAAVCAVLAGSGQARIWQPDPSDFVPQNDARHFGLIQTAPTLEQMLEAFNFQNADSATYFIRQTALADGLAGHGLSRTGSGALGGQQVDTWYSAAEDRSVICVGGAGDGGFGQVTYFMSGKVRRADVFLLP